MVLGHKWERAQEIFMEMAADEVEMAGGRNGGKKRTTGVGLWP